MDKLVVISTYIMVILATTTCSTTLPPDINIRKEKTEPPCTVITECPSAIELLRNRNASALRHLFCGYDGKYPKVRCIPAENDDNNIIIFNNTTEAATSRPKKIITTQRDQNLLEEPVTLRPDLDMKSSYPFPSRKVCGIHNPKISDRIIGGVLTDIEEFPWLARIGYKNSQTGEKDMQYCSANLITDRYLLTAAHCVKNSNRVTPVSVRLGEWDEETEKDCMGNRCNDKPVDINIDNIIIHPLFKRQTMENDIALLRLVEPVKFTEFIQPICLPTSEYVASADYVAGTSFWTAGWGLTEFGNPSAIKRKVELEAVSVEICQGIYSEVVHDSSTIICAGGRKGTDSCRGDSGGSLVREIMEDDSINWYILGITSLGTAQCGSEGKPGIYTRITSYMEWIKDNVVT